LDPPEHIWRGIFFVLSGYIITSRLVQERSAEEGSIDLRGFYLRRAFRILPLVIVYLATVCVVWLFSDLHDFHFPELIGSLFFFRNYQFAAYPHDLFTAHFWSLSIEEHFYLFWPALVLLLSEKGALWIAFSGAMLSAAWRSYELNHEILLTAAFPGLQTLHTDVRLDGLLLGSAVALLVHRDRGKSTQNLHPKMILVFLLAMIAALLISQGGPSFLLYLIIAITIAFSVAVKAGIVSRSLQFPPLVWIGQISFSLYTCGSNYF
jgi:peptidoglycan/LPS O-acetylase OafA/YrhL